MKKILVGSLIALVVLIIVAVVAIGFFLNDIVKKGVETLGPEIAKVSVKLDSVSLSLLSGSGKVKGLVIGNPEGYKSPQAISVGMASVSVSPGSLLSDKIAVKSVHVESPEITFEGGLGGNNLTKILDNVDSFTGTSTNKSAAAQKNAATKIEVDDLLITDVKVNVILTGLVNKSFPLVIPQIHLTDLGKNSDGITAAELSKQVLHAVIESVTKAVASGATDLGKGATEAVKGAGKTATDSVEKVGKGLGDLFKKK
jgi:uncharacterized protein involved in outer membrane biogenesis